MKSIVILCVLCLSVVARAQEPKLLHVNFEHAYGGLTSCPGSLAGVQALCHYEWYAAGGDGKRVGKGWTPNENVAEADSAIQKELRAYAGQTDTSVAQDMRTTNPSKIQGMQVAQGMNTAKSAQQQAQGLDPNSMKNMSLADKMKLAQQMMGNQNLQTQTATAQQQPAFKQDSLIKLLPAFQSLISKITDLRREFAHKAGRSMAMADSAHRAIAYAWRDSSSDDGDSLKFFWFVDGQPTRSQPHGDKERQEDQAAASAMCSQVSQAASEFAAAFQPLVAKVDEYQTKLKDGNSIETAEVRNPYRSMIGGALGGAVDLQKTTENVILLGIRWLDAPNQGQGGSGGHPPFQLRGNEGKKFLIQA